MKHQIQVLEEKLLSEEVRKSVEKISELLTDDFLEYGSSGNVYDKNSVVTRLSESDHKRMEIENFQIISQSEEVIICNYNLILEGKLHSYRSSVWVKNNSSWQIRFHQGTLIAL